MNDETPLAPGTLRVTVLGPGPIVLELMPPAAQPADVKPADVALVDAASADPGPAGDRPHRPRTAARLIERGAGYRPARFEIVVDGWRFEVEVEEATRAALRDRASRAGRRGQGSGRQVVRAQIPGRIVSVAVSAGDAVEGGQRLLSVEAMKMENAVSAPRAGTIARVGVVAGQTVELGDELVVIE